MFGRCTVRFLAPKSKKHFPLLTFTQVVFSIFTTSLHPTCSCSFRSFPAFILRSLFHSIMPPPYSIMRHTSTPDGILAAVIPIAAIHWTFADLPETFFYVVGMLEVPSSGDWILGDKPGALMKFFTSQVRWVRGESFKVHTNCGHCCCRFNCATCSPLDEDWGGCCSHCPLC
jgi:hypothetical protein